MKKAAIFLMLLMCIRLAKAGNINPNDSSGLASINTSVDLPYFYSAADAEKIITAITNILNIKTDFIVKAAGVPNVEAVIKHHHDYILYNPEFVSEVNEATNNKWACVFILAHEVGHHVEGHTIINLKNRSNAELQADAFAGYTLGKMGASLQEAQQVMYYIANTEASKTHPGRDARLAAIEKGWNDAWNK